MSDVQEAGQGSNAPNNQLVGEMLKSHWRIEDDINSLRMGHMTKVGNLRKQQASVRDRIRDAGISVKAFKELIAQESDRRRIANRQDKLEDDDKDLVEMMKPALGVLADLPLGQHAMAQAEEKAARGRRKKNLNNELDGLGGGQPAAAAGDAPADAEAQHVADNVHKLEAGIKTKTKTKH